MAPLPELDCHRLMTHKLCFVRARTHVSEVRLKCVDPFPLSFRSNEVKTGAAAISVNQVPSQIRFNDRIYWILFDFNTRAHMWVRVMLSLRPIHFHILQYYFSVRCFGLLYRSRLLNSIWINGRSDIISIVILTRANNRRPFNCDTAKKRTKNE